LRWKNCDNTALPFLRDDTYLRWTSTRRRLAAELHAPPYHAAPAFYPIFAYVTRHRAVARQRRANRLIAAAVSGGDVNMTRWS